MKQNHIFLALLAAFIAIGAASVGPWAPSPFTSQTGTNTTAAAWRTALGVAGTSGGSFTNTSLVGGSATGLTNSDLTASRAVVSSASKVLTSSTVTTTELSHLSGVTGGVQTNIDARVSSAVLAGYLTNFAGSATNAALVGGTVTGQTNTDLTASRVMVSDANKVPASSSVTATTLGYLDATSSVQTQLDAKASAANLTTVSNAQITTAANLLAVSNSLTTTAGKLAGYVTNLGGLATNLSVVGLTVTGQTNTDLTASRVMVTDADKKLTSATVTATTLGYLDATSSVQTQLDAKASAANLTTVSNAQITTDGKLAGYVTNLGGLSTNLGISGLTNFDLTASTVPYSDANKKLVSSTVTPTELGHLSGVTGGIQTNISARIPSASGAGTNLTVVGLTVTGQTNTDLTASRVMVTDADKKLASATVTATTLGYLDATSSVQTQLDSKPTVALTNVAQLNQSQTWTGTPTFPAAFFLTNAIYERWLMTTNFSFYGNASTNAGYPTNAGDYASITPIISFTCPALIGANSALRFRVVLDKTNTTTTISSIFVYAGPNTNWAGVCENPGTVALGSAERFVGPFLRNFGSFTNQIANSTATWLNYAQAPAHVVDTSSPFTVYVGITTTGSAVGIGVRQIVVTEMVVP